MPRNRGLSWVLLLSLATACQSGTLDEGPWDGGDDRCPEIPCGAGQHCEDGFCVPDEAGPCDLITCPADQSCVDGVCVPDDPCAGVVCENEGETCQGGRHELVERESGDDANVIGALGSSRVVDGYR